MFYIVKCIITNDLVMEPKFSEAVLQMCSYEKVFWKYAADLQENIHAKVGFQ